MDLRKIMDDMATQLIKFLRPPVCASRRHYLHVRVIKQSEKQTAIRKLLGKRKIKAPLKEGVLLQAQKHERS